MTATQLASLSYVVATTAAAREFEKRCRERFRTREEVLAPRRVTYLDTFDWRLHRHGGSLTLVPVGDRWDLSWHSRGGELLHRLRVSSSPAFVWDLPAGAFRQALTPVIEMRRLLPAVRVGRRPRGLAVLDANEKTVARIRLDQLTASPPERGRPRAVPPRLTIVPVRGYSRAFHAARRFAEKDLQLPVCDSDELSLALSALGRQPGAYSSKLRVELDPDMRSDLAAKKIFRALLETMTANETGVSEDLDSEFLHDFRVSVRRTRCCLRQMKSVLPTGIAGKFADEFSWLGKLTGPTRDLDVYLLKMGGYRQSLPEPARSELAPLGEFLRRYQGVEQRRLATSLAAKRYRALKRNWKKFIESDDTQAAPAEAERPIREIASERIGRCHQRILKRARAIGTDAPMKKLHRLRLECKELRYLLECFASLYDPIVLGALVRELKRLQDLLGDLNDLQVQQEALVGFGHQMEDEGSATVELLMAMGRLLDRLEKQQGEKRKRFAKRFEKFRSRNDAIRVRELLASVHESSSAAPQPGEHAKS